MYLLHFRICNRDGHQIPTLKLSLFLYLQTFPWDTSEAEVIFAEFVDVLRKRDGKNSVATASLGIAGNDIGGCTIHHFSGIDTGD